MSKFEFVSRAPVSCMKSVAVVGCGTTALYLLKHIVDNRSYGLAITFFSASSSLGVGMPYDADWVGEEALANIACEEVPDLPIGPQEWFCGQSDGWLDAHHLERQAIGPGFIPTRHALGHYFEAQFQSLLHSAATTGLSVRCLRQTTVTDLQTIDQRVMLTFCNGALDEGESVDFDYAVMATGQLWPQPDLARPRYLPSPWPVSQLQAAEGRRIGLIGTSLSAIDACLTLARKNGVFCRDSDGRLVYLPAPAASEFMVVMHSRQGQLPPVQVHVDRARFATSAYFSEAEIQRYMAENGNNLSLDFLFERVLKTVLQQMSPLLHAVIAPMDLATFVHFLQMQQRSEDPFEPLREDYALAALRDRGPVFSKAVLDAIADTLNTHSCHLNAADTLWLRSHWMPLVKDLIAVLPPQTCEQILALRDAGCLDVLAVGEGLTISAATAEADATLVFTDEKTGQPVSLAYDLLVDCRDQQLAGREDLPFPTPASDNAVTGSGAADPPTGSIRVDPHFHPLSRAGTPTNSIIILATPMIDGGSPEPSGLPFCSGVAAIAARDLDAATHHRIDVAAGNA